MRDVATCPGTLINVEQVQDGGGRRSRRDDNGGSTVLPSTLLGVVSDPSSPDNPSENVSSNDENMGRRLSSVAASSESLATPTVQEGCDRSEKSSNVVTMTKVSPSNDAVIEIIQTSLPPKQDVASDRSDLGHLKMDSSSGSQGVDVEQSIKTGNRTVKANNQSIKSSSQPAASAAKVASSQTNILTGKHDSSTYLTDFQPKLAVHTQLANLEMPESSVCISSCEEVPLTMSSPSSQLDSSSSTADSPCYSWSQPLESTNEVVALSKDEISRLTDDLTPNFPAAIVKFVSIFFISCYNICTCMVIIGLPK